MSLKNDNNIGCQVEEGMVGLDGDGGDQTWGGDHTGQCTGGVL